MYGEGNQEALHGRILFPYLPCISRIFRPECSFGREESMNLCIQISRFPLSGSQGALRAERILQNTLNHDNQAKARISSHPAWARIPGRQVQGCCRKSPSCSPALTPDSERPAILTGTDVHPCFCAGLSVVFMQKSCEYRFLVHRHSQLFIHIGYFYFFVKA